jgi:hypothetical protein
MIMSYNTRTDEAAEKDAKHRLTEIIQSTEVKNE